MLNEMEVWFSDLHFCFLIFFVSRNVQKYG